MEMESEYGYIPTKNIKNIRVNENIEDMINRKLYLKKIQDGVILGPRCNFASKDMAWLQFFSDEQIASLTPSKKIIDVIRDNSKEYLDKTAIRYFDNKISYNKLIKMSMDAYDAFDEIGITDAKRVAFCMPTTPESIACFLGLNDMRSTSVWMDPRAGAERLKKSIVSSGAKTLVAIDILYPKIKPILNELNLENKVILIPATVSLPFKLGNLIDIKNSITGKKIKDNNVIYWNDFIKLGKRKKHDHGKYPYNGNFIAAIEFTSGTSSEPKGVEITNDAINAVAHEYRTSGVPNNVGDRFLNVMPMFLLYGLACGIAMPLSMGMENIVIPQLDFSKIGDLFYKYKPNHFAVNPIIFDNLTKSEKMKNADLSYIVSAGIGGSGLTADQEKRFNEFLESHGCKYRLAKGYGATEAGSSCITVVSKETDKFRSVGVPLPKMVAAVFKYKLDEDYQLVRTTEELQYGEEGEICLCGSSIMNGYMNNEKLTNSVLLTHEDGTVWLHTGDRGYIDSDGFVFVYDRIGRMIILPDSHNVYLASIEEVINKHPAVDSCAVVGIKAENFDKGKFPKAVVKIKDNCDISKEQLVNELVEMCYNELPERDVAKFYEIVDEFPMTLGSKYDYPKMEENIIGEFIDPKVKVSDMVKMKIKK